jgi:predicted dienelactone hydrolase
MKKIQTFALWLSAVLLSAASTLVQAASLGLQTLPATSSTAEITLYYPSSSPVTALQRGPFTLQVAHRGEYEASAQPRPLIMFSHGSGGSPWPVADLALAMVDAGYVVAIPTHAGDNYRDMSQVGPASWKQRPLEISRALDALASDPQWGARLNLKQVGLYGMSAGGHTALTLAGGRWSSGNFMRHCLENMESDFNACVGTATHLRGNALDGLKLTVARAEHRRRFDDDTLFAHSDARIRAVLAHVPMAAPFEMSSFAKISIPLGILPATQDDWLRPQFHSDRVLAACPSCEQLQNLPHAKHGSLFSPWPPELAASLTPMLVDSPDFDRSQLPKIYAKMVVFFQKHMPASP